jgi:hypothetical protein
VREGVGGLPYVLLRMVPNHYDGRQVLRRNPGIVGNVTAAEFERYLLAYRTTLTERCDRFIGSDPGELLPENWYLHQTLVGYVSTSKGVAFEWTDGPEATKIQRGSAEVERLLFAYPNRVGKMKPFFLLEANGVEIHGGKWTNGKPLELVEGGSAVLDRMQFEVGGWQRTIHYAELFFDRNADSWTEADAVSRASEKVLVALVQKHDAERRSIGLGDYLQIFKERMVLVLGAYEESGLERLGVIRRTLESLGYSPVLLKDVEDYPEYDLEQKLVAIGSVARFVVIDDSEPSGHLAEFVRVRDNRWITALLRVEGVASSFVTAGASIDTNVIREFHFGEEAVREAAEWAEQAVEERADQLQRVYPWREPQ